MSKKYPYPASDAAAREIVERFREWLDKAVQMCGPVESVACGAAIWYALHVDDEFKKGAKGVSRSDDGWVDGFVEAFGVDLYWGTSEDVGESYSDVLFSFERGDVVSMLVRIAPEPRG